MNSLSPKTQELIAYIKRYKEGITVYKQSVAIQYSKDNKPEDRVTFLKYDYAEMQVDNVLSMLTKGLIEIHHETNARITQAINENKPK
jgi:hypothetical protein